MSAGMVMFVIGFITGAVVGMLNMGLIVLWALDRPRKS